jgi:ribonuclease Z
MTAAEAAALAAKAKARKLVLTHISPRHKDSRPVLDEAKAVFPHVEVADDFFAVEVPVRGDPVPVPGEGLAQKAKA